ncbi:MAG TPA: RIP metalloprotease RseP, partial [Anaerolineae bacterium]|nr:RIP metalloprotease RseP [Anaerolineae bacterium]
GTVAEQIGLKSGDEIVALNGKKVEELEQALFSLYTEQKSTITVRDSFGERTVEVNKKLGANEEFGVVPYLKAQVEKIIPESPADQAGFKSGDVIAAINGELITGGWYHMSEIVRANPDRDMIFTLERDGEDIQCQVRVGNVVEDLPDGSTKKIGRIGISPLILNLKVNGFESIIKAVRETGFFAIHTIDFFIKLVTGRMSAKLLGGPVLIAQMAGESAKTGLANLLFFTAFISINLGVLNLLPFPVLDGGHIFILLIETVIRRKLSTRIRMAVQQVGSIILLLFMIYITFNDIMRFDTISRFLGGK